MFHPAVQVLSFGSYDATNNKPLYTSRIANFPVDQNGQPILSTFRTDAVLPSRWQAEFGLRYNFN